MGSLNKHIPRKIFLTYSPPSAKGSSCSEYMARKAQPLQEATKTDNPLMEYGVQPESTSRKEDIFPSTRSYPLTTDSYG